MAKEKQQELPQHPEVTRLAVSISKSSDGKYTIEDLHLAGDKVVTASPIVSLDGTKGIRIAAGTFLNMAEDRVREWQKEGLLK